MSRNARNAFLLVLTSAALLPAWAGRRGRQQGDTLQAGSSLDELQKHRHLDSNSSGVAVDPILAGEAIPRDELIDPFRQNGHYGSGGPKWVHRDIWHVLRHTGRHSWRHRAHKQPHHVTSPRSEGTVFNDWCFFLIVLALASVIHVVLLQKQSSTVLHILSFIGFLAVGISYGAVVFLRLGSNNGFMWATGYLLEFVNQIENVFTLHIILRALRVPEGSVRKVMFITMLCQIAFDTVMFMGLGDWLRHIRMLPYVLGIWLLYCGWMVATGDSEDYPEAADTVAVRFLRQCLGDRFSPSYDEAGHVFVIKGDRVIISLLGPVIICVLFADFFLESDVTLTKIEVFPVQYISYTSSVVASFLLLDIFAASGKLLMRFHLLRFGVGFITAFFGVQMLASEFYMIPAAVNCAVMVSVVIFCCVLSTCVKQPQNGVPALPEPQPQEGS